MTRALYLHPEGSGWQIMEGPAGAAGHVDLRLQHENLAYRVSLDVLAPDVLVDMFVPAQGSTGAVPDDYAALLTELFGSGLVAALPPLSGQSKRIEVPQTAAWQALAAAGSHQLRRQLRRPVSRLAGLEALTDGDMAALSATRRLGEDLGWRALPAVIALGRVARRAAEVVDVLEPGHRDDLLRVLTVAKPVLETAGWTGGGRAELDDLIALLTPVRDVDLITWAPPLTAALRDGGQPAEPGGEWRWHAAPEEMRSRLGGLAELAFAGTSAYGRLPGTVDVRIPLRPGSVAPDAEGWTVRLLTVAGRALAEGSTEVRQPRTGVPYAQCRLEITDAVDDGNFVLLDVGRPGSPPPSPHDLRDIARRRAARYGREAVAAELRGDAVLQAASWQDCAANLMAAGAEEEARQAADRARGGRYVEDWLGRLQASLLMWADLERTAAAGDLRRLRSLQRDLTAMLDPVAATARTHEALAELLSEGPAQDEDGDPQEQALAHLDAALALYLQFGDETSVNRVLRRSVELRDRSADS